VLFLRHAQRLCRFSKTATVIRTRFESASDFLVLRNCKKGAD